ncbi:MAG: arsenate reductase (glutaredoxin) [Flavobacteriia bacterium]|nr:arsenate reductase (glutaredoxin) [Flavobacteriia bacterium]
MNQEIIIYHNPKCSKSREALCLLEEKGIKPTIVEYLKNSPNQNDIKALLSKLSISALEIMRKGEEEYKEHVKGKELNEEELISILVQYPKLIERPIVIKDNKAIIGRPPSLILDLVG